MRTVTLEAIEGESTGEVGWIILGKGDWMEPFGAQTLAHDIMEHRRSDTGTQAQECMALGASLLVREFYIHSRAMYSPRNCGFGNDIGGFTRDSGFDLQRCPQTRKSDDGDLENIIKRTKDGLLKGVLDYHDYNEDEFFDPDQPGFTAPWRISRPDFEQFKEDCGNWIRRGYFAAKRRYAGVRPYQLWQCFQNLTKALGSEPEFEGARCRVRFDVASGFVEVIDMYEDDYGRWQTRDW